MHLLNGPMNLLVHASKALPEYSVNLSHLTENHFLALLEPSRERRGQTPDFTSSEAHH